MISARWLKWAVPNFGAPYGKNNSVYISTDMMPLWGFQIWGWGRSISLGHRNRKIPWFHLAALPFPRLVPKEYPWAYSFSSGKRRSQHKHLAAPESWDASWEAHLDIASLGELARDKSWGGAHSNECVDFSKLHSCWQRWQIRADISTSNKKSASKEKPRMR